jgi:mono/diheme cytochrome c family protein
MPVIAAVNTQQKLGGLLVVALVVGWAVYIVAQLRRPEAPPPGAEIELAPNRKRYVDDDELEGPKLEKAQKWGLALLVVSALGLPLYWMGEPGRQAGAAVGFDKRAAHRGFLLFQPADSPIPPGNVGHFGCGGCHGVNGEGGSAPFSLADPANPSVPPRQVRWTAPPLNTVTLRYTDDQIRAVLVYGRAGTPMPPWGVLGGGPMNDQQITDLVHYLHSIALKPKDAQAQAVKQYGETDGRALFEGFCARCHTKGWSFGEPDVAGGGAFGPSLVDGATLRQFPGIDKHLDFITNGAAVDPAPLDLPAKPYGKPYGVRGVLGYEGGGMPAFGKMLTAKQIQAIVDYERGL